MENFLGAPYPIQTDARGYLHTISDVDTLRADLLILMLTNPGERVMLPSYGTDFRQLLFEPNDAILESRAVELISNSIRTWEPRITVKDIQVNSQVSSTESTLNPSDDLTNLELILTIKIVFFDPQDIQNVQELVLQVPLQAS